MWVSGTQSDQDCSITLKGRALSSLSFILYTNVCQSEYEYSTVIKHAHDSVIGSLLQGDETRVRSLLTLRTLIFSWTHVKLKRGNLISEQTRTQPGLLRVKQWKYLGTIIDSELHLELNSEAVCEKGHQRPSCLRKLSRFHFWHWTVRILFYHLSNLLPNSLLPWCGHFSLKNRNCLKRIWWKGPVRWLESHRIAQRHCVPASRSRSLAQFQVKVKSANFVWLYERSYMRYSGVPLPPSWHCVSTQQIAATRC